ncbi:MAG: sel1 repeat family protein [Cystobacterineae bacterium]|nr:sel1 repeat family protein [Cystobacterineae bacterium]
MKNNAYEATKAMVQNRCDEEKPSREAGGGDKEALENFIGAAHLEDRETQYHLGIIYEYIFEDYEKAVEWLSKAAETKHVEALFRLGEIYSKGQGVPVDLQRAMECYSKAINKGHVEAHFKLGLMHESAEDHKLAVRRFKKAAEMGHAEAQFHLGKMYYEGRSVIINKPRGFQLLREASKNGHREAVQLYEQAREEVSKNAPAKVVLTEADKKLLEGLKKSAEEGCVESQWKLGGLYREGLKIEKNLKSSNKWYEKAARGLAKLAMKENADAQRKLAEIYKDGLGSPKDNELSMAWYKKATDSYMKLAEQGDVEAQYRLGEIYLKGRVLDKDRPKAMEWFAKAAEQGHAQAQYYIGKMYARGESIPKDTSKAMEWYTKAAKQGHAKAELYLKKICLEEAENVPEKQKNKRAHPHH